MPQKANTYTGGLDRDTSRGKYSPDRYYYLLNGRVVTKEGLSTGSIENEEGTSLNFDIPDLGSVYSLTIPDGYSGPSNVFLTPSVFITVTSTTIEEIYEEIINTASIAALIAGGYFNVGLGANAIVFTSMITNLDMSATNGVIITELVSAVTGLKIVGMGLLRNKVIIITTDGIVESPTNTSGQIWVVEYDETTELPTNLTGNSLTPGNHLVYNGQLNLSLYHRVGEIIGRYENTKTQRIYWTDNYNPVRVFNIAAGVNGFALTSSELSLQPDVAHVEPVYQSISSGSIPTPSVVQYGYRLKSYGGVTTSVSPLSPLLPLSGDDPNTSNYFEFRGEVSSGARSVTYKISDLDSRFDLVEHIVVLYQNSDVPQIYKFGEDTVPESGSLIVTHVGNEDYEELTEVELNALSSGFRKAKSITQRRNRLIAGNISTEKVDLDFDARAYRFDNSRVATLYDSQGNVEFILSGPSPNYALAGETDDCINPFNDDNPTTNPNWSTADQYKYQADGVTLGGSGLNISYSFVQHTFKNTDYYPISPSATPNRPYQTGLLNGTSTPTYYEGEVISVTQFTDFKSPYAHAYLKGYTRGEVYRFGIKFIDKAGNPTYVKWIGDIKFPEIQDGFKLGQANSGWATPLDYDLNSLGIEFVVDISDVIDQISGFSIVRVERTEDEKTVLGSGFIQHYSTSKHQQHLHNKIQGTTFTCTNHTIVSGSDIECMYLMDRPGTDNPFGASVNLAMAFISPYGQYSYSPFKDGDFLRVDAYYDAEASIYYKGGSAGVGVHYKALNRLTSTAFTTVEDERYNLDEVQQMTPNFNYLWANQNLTIINSSYSKQSGGDKWIPCGVGNNKLLCISDNYNISYPASNYTEFTSTAAGGNSEGVGGYCTPMKLATYRRYLVKQYGGDSYIARAGQVYIDCNFVPVNSTSTTTQTVTTFGGDTFVNMYGDESFFMHYTDNNGSRIFDDPSSLTEKVSTGYIFPVESTVNFGYISNSFTWVYDKSTADMGNEEETTYSYYSLYSQENNVSTKNFTKPTVITDIEEHPHRIWASEPKIDGEEQDSWRLFKANNFLEVDGLYGQINKVISFKDNLFYYQDRAVGTASVEDRSQTTDQAGIEIVLGTGAVLDYYKYLSTETGTQHQFSVVNTGSSLYHVDAYRRKVFKLSEGLQSVSDVKGLSAYLDNYLKGNILTNDVTARLVSTSILPIGIHGEYDPRFNRVLFTFLNSVDVPSEIDDAQFNTEADNFTLSYNERLDAFESFYSFTPTIYLNTGIRVLSVNPTTDLNEVYSHNTGARGVFYGTTYNMELIVPINHDPSITKEFDNIQYNMDATDTSGVDDYDDTFNSIQVYNGYQDSGVITLTAGQNVVRRMRTWRLQVPRNNTVRRDRIRDYNMFTKFVYNNSLGNRIILHDLITSYRYSPL